MDFLGLIIYSFLGFLFLSLIYTLWLLIDILPTAGIPRGQTRGKGRQNTPNASSSLERKLLSLVGGDQSLATRLLFNIRWKNPQKSRTWCYEKVIYDLQRDRGAI
jgi:hypothetical protein